MRKIKVLTLTLVLIAMGMFVVTVNAAKGGGKPDKPGKPGDNTPVTTVLTGDIVGDGVVREEATFTFGADFGAFEGIRTGTYMGIVGTVLPGGIKSRQTLIFDCVYNDELIRFKLGGASVYSRSKPTVYVFTGPWFVIKQVADAPDIVRVDGTELPVKVYEKEVK